MNKISILSLIEAKAKENNNIVIYERFGNGYNIPYSYGDVYLITFTDINAFCNDLYHICEEVYPYLGKLPHLVLEDFYNKEFKILIDHQEIIVMNYSNENLEHHQDFIMEYFNHL